MSFLSRQFARIKYKKHKLIGTIIAFAYIVVLSLLGVRCIFIHFLGYPCPGCGMTRAWISALHLNFPMAFKYHPLFWAVIPLYLYIIFDGALFGRKWLDRTVLIIFALAFTVLEAVRLIFPATRAILY